MKPHPNPPLSLVRQKCGGYSVRKFCTSLLNLGIADKEEKKRKADKPKQKPLTEAERKDAEEVAGALGYRVEWVDTMEENGTIDADKKVIRIARMPRTRWCRCWGTRWRTE